MKSLEWSLIQHGCYPYRRHTWGEHQAKLKAEIRGLRLQAEECRRLPATTRGYRRGLRQTLPCPKEGAGLAYQRHDVGLPASRNVRQFISFVQVTWFVEFCHGSLSKPIQTVRSPLPVTYGVLVMASKWAQQVSSLFPRKVQSGFSVLSLMILQHPSSPKSYLGRCNCFFHEQPATV